MAKFFIDRPIFAWVIALFIMVMGAVSITQLPIAQYPPVAPPSIVINATYPGASASTLENSVLSVIEQEMNGSPGLIYMESVAQANGTGSITLSFETGTDAALAQVDVQNRLSRASPRLPAAVTQQGVRVDRSRSNFLLFAILSSDDPAWDPVALGDYASRSVVPELQRLPGVGQAQLFGTERAMRIWIDPAKLLGFNLSAADVTNAIRAQNAQVSAGEIGALPNVGGQSIAATVVVNGQLASVEQFGNVVLRASADGATVRLKDVARIELGAQAYATSARLNGKPSTGIGVQLSPSGNALATADAVRAKMTELERFFPAGMTWAIPYDSSRFVKISIEQVAITLGEAMLLVFLVMFLFLQNFRYTVIPTIVVPVALLGTFAVLLAMGFSINVLTMFGMVLVIGIVVDDAIVVVENVERIMSEEGLPPLEATRKAMTQISGAIIGVTVVLISVFVPLAFFAGSVGNIYRQFSAVMGVSIAFSAFLALSLTPALCATLLKPVEAGHHHEKKGFFGWFNRGFARTAKGYEGGVAKLLPRAGRTLVIYLAIVAAAVVVYMRLPTSFLPGEDQGTMLVNVQLPPGATQERTLEVIKQVEGFILKQPEVQSMVGVLGFSFSGQGQNAALAFITLKDWKERTAPGSSAEAVAGRAFGALSGVRDAFIFPLSPPPIPELGSSSGFSFRLQDRAGLGREALLNARNQLLGLASQSKVLAQVRPDGLEDAPQLQIDIDRDKANALGVGFDAINAAIGTALGSSYVNDFPNAGRLQRVVVQADAPARMQPEDLLRINVVNSKAQAVPLSAFATTQVDHRPDADRALQRLPVHAHQRQCGARRQHGCGHCRDGAARRPVAAGHRLRVDRSDARGKARRLAGHHPVRLRHPGRVPVPGRAVRELDDSAVGDSGGAAGRDRGAAGHADARVLQRRVLPGRTDHHHRSVGEERDPDHRVCERPAGAGQGRDRVGAGRRPPAFPPHRHDLAGVHAGCVAAGPGLWRWLGQPARHRHRRDRRHAHRHRAGGRVCADLLCGGAHAVQRQRATTPA